MFISSCSTNDANFEDDIQFSLENTNEFTTKSNSSEILASLKDEYDIDFEYIEEPDNAIYFETEEELRDFTTEFMQFHNNSGSTPIEASPPNEVNGCSDGV